MKAMTVAIALMLTSGAAVAETGTYVRPVLELAGGLCPATKQLALDWAREYKTTGSFALPIKRGNPNARCDESIPARSGFSFGYDDQLRADAVALQACNDQNAGNPNVGNCVIVGRLRPGPV